MDQQESHETSSFLFQSSDNYFDQGEELQYELIAPLCVGSLYENDFFDRFHLNYFGEFEHDGLFLVSVRAVNTSAKDGSPIVRAIIRTTTNNYDVSEKVDSNNEEAMLQSLFAKVQLPPLHHYAVIHHIQANEKILEFDRSNDDQCANKVAVVFQRLNQCDEIEILSNQIMPVEMEDFLELISERVQLKDFTGYRGDLDTKTDEHGTSTYFTVFDNHQIMFNVAPMIPFDENDQQCLQRKSLIANAFLCIVFQEEDAVFHPSMLPGKVTQIFITIQPVRSETGLYYKIGIWRRADIEPIAHPPILIFKHQPLLRSYFLALVLNSMYTIFRKDYFHLRITKQRQRLKHEYLQKLGELFECLGNYGVSSVERSGDTPSPTPEQSRSRPSSPTKHHRLRLIPKLINAFSGNRPKSVSFTSISSSGDFSNKPSPTTADLHVWGPSAAYPKQNTFIVSNTSIATGRSDSSLSQNSQTIDHHYQSPATVATQVDVIQSLVTHLPNAINANC